MNTQELDFPTIRENFKRFLKDQDEFTDYDLTQSGLDVIINMLAYGIHYDAFQANFSNNEMFLEAAQLRRNAVSRAKHLMYTPKSRVAARLVADVTVEDTDTVTLPNTLFLPKGSKFTSKNQDARDVVFVTTESYAASKDVDSFFFPNVSMYEGSYVVTYEAYDGKSVEIKNGDVDTRFLEVYVQEDPQSVTYHKYTPVDNILNVAGDSRVFYLEENFNENFKVYFGDGVLGKKVANGRMVMLTYLVTAGADGNGISSVGFSKSPSKSDDVNFGQTRATVKEVSSGGAERESIESIKFNAPRYFSTQKIILNDTDATFIIPKMFSDIKSVNIWSGKGSGAFGKTYLSLNPYEDNLTDQRIEEILTEVEKSRFVILTELVHVSPSYIDLGIKLNVYFSNSSSFAAAKTDLYDSILEYSEKNIEDFKKNFISSKFISAVQTDDIVEYDFDLVMKNRLPIFTNSVENYFFDFKNEVTSLKTSEFTWQGQTAYIASDIQGILYIYSSSNNTILSNIGEVDLSTGSGAIYDINIQYALDNEVTITAVPKRESIFGVNNNILRILEKDIEITYEIKN